MDGGGKMRRPLQQAHQVRTVERLTRASTTVATRLIGRQVLDRIDRR
jgi:hypothetical protein